MLPTGRKLQNKQLRQLNDAIAEETKNTVLEAFNNELSASLANAKTVLEMLKVIEAKRKELSGDGTELIMPRQNLWIMPKKKPMPKQSNKRKPF